MICGLLEEFNGDFVVDMVRLFPQENKAWEI